jgi:hypothetical protein
MTVVDVRFACVVQQMNIGCNPLDDASHLSSIAASTARYAIVVMLVKGTCRKNCC